MDIDFVRVFNKLPKYLQAIILALLSVLLNITILLFISLILPNILGIDRNSGEVLGVSTVRDNTLDVLYHSLSRFFR